MKPVSALWRMDEKRQKKRLDDVVDRALAGAARQAIVMFRADDIGVASRSYFQMMDLFAQKNVPLSLAVVPAWLSAKRFETVVLPYQKVSADLWCWHMHGFRHTNHQVNGKKMEFGPSRDAEQLLRDLKQGKKKMADIMGDSFFPAFTPPWNRFDEKTPQMLGSLGFRAISTSGKATLPDLDTRPYDFFVNVDLHTRKEDAQRGWDNLFFELEQSLTNGYSGIMIHHQRMNDSALDFMASLLDCLSHRNDVHLVHLEHLCRSAHAFFSH